MISKEQEAEIQRLFRVEKWKVGTIAKHLEVHHSVVTRIIERREEANQIITGRTSKIDTFKPYIKETLKDYPDLTCTRLYEMLVSRGYTGQVGLVRLVSRELRGSKKPEAFLRLCTLAGEEAQVDWGHFGRIEIGQASRPLMGFVMVLSHSRAIYLQFFMSQGLSNFLQGHELAFNWFGGIPRICLYDNLKSLVIDRVGKAIKYNESFLDYASYHHFQPRPVAVRRGNEKGRVERAIRYIRESFFAARKFKDIHELNEQALTWCNTISLDRKWPDDDSKTVRQAFEAEKSLLLPLADNPYPCEERKEVVVGKTPYIQFDLNSYSVPHTAVKKTLFVLASPTRVRIFDGQQEIASHARSYDRKQQIENPAHIRELVELKAEAAVHRNTDFLIKSLPSARELLELAAKKGEFTRTTTKQLAQFVTLYGPEAVEKAIKEAIEKVSPHPNSIRTILERNRLDQGRSLPLSTPITADPRAQKIVVQPQDLKKYDQLITTPKKEDENE